MSDETTVGNGIAEPTDVVGASAPASAASTRTFVCPQCRMSFAPVGVGFERGRKFTVSPCCNKTMWFDDIAPLPAAEQSFTSAANILRTAATLVSGDREAVHGDKELNHMCIADMWNAYLTAKLRAHAKNGGTHVPLTAEDVASMMEALKIARRLTGSHNPDDYIDGAGYAAVAGEIAERTR